MVTAQPVFLVDSSVIVKWYHEEEYTPVALRLREIHLQGQWELRLADITFYELANALHFGCKMTSAEIIARVQSLLAMELRIYGFDNFVLRRALDLCAEKHIAIYDAYLIALAKQERLIFVTADEKLWRKFSLDDSVKSLRSLASLFKGDSKTYV